MIYHKPAQWMPKLTKMYVFAVVNEHGQLLYIFNTKADAHNYIGANIRDGVPADSFKISKRTVCGF